MIHHMNVRGRHPELSVEKSARVNYLARGRWGQETGFVSGTVKSISPGHTQTLTRIPGHGAVSTILVRIRASDLESALAARLKIYIGQDPVPSVDQPIRGFFLSGLEGKTTIGDYAGKNCSADGKGASLYRHLFIPYTDGIRLCVENTVDEAISVGFSLQYSEQQAPRDYGRYSKAYGSTVAGRSNQWGEEVTLLEVDGSGVLDSVQMSLLNAQTRGQYMEGNIQIYIDHNAFPEYQSSGTEEFFMGGVYFANLHSSAYSGCTRTFNDGTENADHIVSAYRHFVDDSITFDRHLRVVWHNGQPLQGAVVGTTEYEFSFIYYRDEYKGETARLTAEDASLALSRVDRDRLRHVLAGGTSSVSVRTGETTLVELAGPGSLETLYVASTTEDVLRDAMLVLEIDGDRTPEIPLPWFFLTSGQSAGYAADTGKTSASSYYRYCDINFQRSLRIMATTKGPGGDVLTSCEYRRGLRTEAARYGVAWISSAGEGPSDSQPWTGAGAVEAVFVQADGLPDGVVEFTRTDGTPVGVEVLSDLLLSPEDFGVEEGVSSDVGVVEREASAFSGYRVFEHSPFHVDQGLRIKLFPRNDTTTINLVVFYRAFGGRNQTEDESIPATTRRLNQIDGAADRYETNCYNPMEGHDGAIAPGETDVVFEDFDAGVIRCLRFGTPPVGRALHNSLLQFYVDGSKRPAISTTCGRFFSADYDDPLYWDQTRYLSRVSKRDRQPLDRQHTSFFRYINLPYKKSARITLTAPDDCGINGFDNVYFGSARSGAEDFGMFNRFECVSREQTVAPDESVVLATHNGVAAITSVQLMVWSDENDEYLNAKLQVLLDGRPSPEIDVPLFAFFFGAPPGVRDATVKGSYGPPWTTALESEEAYYSAGEHGWIRRGRGKPYRNVMYRLLDRRPILTQGETKLQITNATGATFVVQSDVIVRTAEGG